MSKQSFCPSDHIKVVVIVINVPIPDSAEVGSDSITIRSEIRMLLLLFFLFIYSFYNLFFLFNIDAIYMRFRE